MLEQLITSVLLPTGKKIVNTMIDDAMERVEQNADKIMDRMSEKFDEMTVRSARIVKELVPPIIYGAMFFGVGVIILVLGASTYVDSVIQIEGAGFMLGGLFLLLIGLYYKVQLDKAMEKVENM